MTRPYNDPSNFTDAMIDGFVAAHHREIRRVTGGIARSTQSVEPTVAVVVGGGSGHYPAFAGLVGPGLADGAVMGNVFASPSAHQVESVAREVERGRGVLLTYGSYAGDGLNFDAAQERLRADGIDCRTVRVTDDVHSAPAEEHTRRRGIAGDLTVFKVAGAAAQLGYDLDAVERVTRSRMTARGRWGSRSPDARYREHVRPCSPCPGGRMAIGLGIHGEPGVDVVEIPTADALAELFVERLLAQCPAGAESSDRGGSC